jgi:hypothetical protein
MGGDKGLKKKAKYRVCKLYEIWNNPTGLLEQQGADREMLKELNLYR